MDSAGAFGPWATGELVAQRFASGDDHTAGSHPQRAEMGGLFNLRPKEAEPFLRELDKSLWDATGRVKKWPKGDLFRTLLIGRYIRRRCLQPIPEAILA